MSEPTLRFTKEFLPQMFMLYLESVFSELGWKMPSGASITIISTEAGVYTLTLEFLPFWNTPHELWSKGNRGIVQLWEALNARHVHKIEKNLAARTVIVLDQEDFTNRLLRRLLSIEKPA